MKDEKIINAFKYLQASSYPDEKAIEEMSEEEVTEFLKQDDVNIEELELKIEEQKKRFAGKYALLMARSERLSEKSTLEFVGEIPETKEDIIESLQNEFGDSIPMAARNFQSAEYEELRTLYIDLMRNKDAE